jgi:DNA-binding NarL/FixJ family response regulator
MSGVNGVIGRGLMSAGPIRLVLAGADERLRERVHAAIEARPQMFLVGEVIRGDEAISAVAELAPDVLILHMEITGVHACSVTRAALALRPQLGIVVWIALDDSTEVPDEQALWKRHGGVCCCIDDAADHEEITQALLCASTGTTFLSHRLTLWASLTPREHEVLALRAAGWRTAQIARTLKLAPGTVYRHTERICRKLGLARYSEAAEAGRDLGLGRDMDATTDLNIYSRAFHLRREEFYQARRASGL